MRLPGLFLSRLFKDPAPAWAFEIGEAGLAFAYVPDLPGLSFRPLKPGAISVSPLHDNVLEADEVALAVRAVAPPNGKRRDVAVILPDNCARVFVLDFDGFPEDPKEQAPLVRFRLKKSVPFDIEAAALSYFPQPTAGKQIDVVAVVAPDEIIARYEAPFRAVQMNPGLLTLSSLSVLRLVTGKELTVVAKLSSGAVTLMVLDQGLLKLYRCLETFPGNDLVSDIYPTLAYAEDQFGRKAGRLLLCGFGSSFEETRQRFHTELNIPVDALTSRLGPPGENNAGLIGYLQGVMEEG